jgi:cytochrome c oxidase cbb3-type subunit III
MCAKQVKKTENAVGTTGHVWDGIEELNSPLPRWWVWVFYLTIIWGIGYTIAYPAWPMLNGATRGVIGSDQRAAVAAEIQRFDDANAAIKAQLVSYDLMSTTPMSPEVEAFALNEGMAVFNSNCVQCHGREGGGGAAGYPVLSDDDWLYGGSLDAIHTTVLHGIRNTTDADARNVGLVMPAWSDKATGEMADAASAKLTDEQVGQVVNYVLKLSGQPADEAQAAAGAQIFAENCVACHGEDGKGNRDMGAPNLTDAIWLYGGDAAALTSTVSNGRSGVMPSWATKLSEDQIRAVAAYVHSRGGGE